MKNVENTGGLTNIIPAITDISQNSSRFIHFDADLIIFTILIGEEDSKVSSTVDGAVDVSLGRKKRRTFLLEVFFKRGCDDNP